MVGHLTIGLSLSTGRGATAAAFERRALRRLSLRPGYTMLVLHPVISCSVYAIYLVEVDANSSLPILSEICRQLVQQLHESIENVAYGCGGSVDYA